jgi:general secretion pathway protein M
MSGVHAWWESLIPREKLIVGVLGSLIVVIIFKSLVWQPIYQAREHALNAEKKQSETLIWLKQQAQIVNSMTPKSGFKHPVVSSTSQRVNTTAQKHQIEISRFQASEQGKIQVWLVEVDFGKFLRWLDELSEQGIHIESTSISKTDKPGLVDVRIALADG